MAYVGGYSGGYDSIAGYRLYLDLSSNDVEFETGYVNPLQIEAISEYHAPNQMYQNLPNTRVDNIWTTISSVPQSKAFSNLISKFGLENYINGDKTRWNMSEQMTMFVPVTNIEKILGSIQNSNTLRMEHILQCHLVNFPILPVQLFDGINRIETLYKGQNITIRGTENEMFIITPENINELNRIVSCKQTNNGMIYFIEKPLFPYTR
jgi:uncharacterized surface protein with fasciclin (FAS1) repeats